MLYLNRISKSIRVDRQKVNILNEVSFALEPGEMLAIMGPSGCGKSTLLNVIAGLIEPDEGEVIFEDADINKLAEEEKHRLRNREIGIIFQKYNLIDALNCYENICVPLALSGKKERKQCGEDFLDVGKVLEMVDMADKKRKKPYQLSGGEQQRIAIGRAIIMKPKLILADEPTGALDETNGRKVLKLLRECNQTYGMSVIIVTHNKEIAQMCDRMLLMKDGKIINER